MGRNAALDLFLHRHFYASRGAGQRRGVGAADGELAAVLDLVIVDQLVHCTDGKAWHPGAAEARGEPVVDGGALDCLLGAVLAPASGRAARRR